MKILSVEADNRKKAFIVRTRSLTYPFPYERADPKPSSRNKIVELFIDRELAREGFTYRLESGAEGSVLWDWVLDVNADPRYLTELLLHNLTVEAEQHLERSKLSRREIARRLGTSPSQLYRLLDSTYYKKSVEQMLALLIVLGCDVDVKIKPRPRKRSA